MCTTSKQGYFTLTEANKVKEKMEKKYQQLYRVYKCEKCLQYHISHKLHKLITQELVRHYYHSPQ